MKKILFYEPSSGYGGSSSNLYHMIQKLNKQDFSAVVVVHEDGPQFDRMRGAGQNVLKIPFDKVQAINNAGNLKLVFYFLIWVFPLALKFAGILKGKKVDLVHVNTNIMLGLPMILAARMTNKPVVCHIRETRPLIRREKILARFVKKIFVLNKEAARLCKKDVPQEKIEVVYDGVDPDAFVDVNGDKIRQEFGWPNAPVVGTAGRLMLSKGQKEFILAACEVLDQCPEARFLVVGSAQDKDKSFEAQIKQYVLDKGLAEKIIFTGWRMDMKDILAALDIFVFPTTTYREGLPNSIIEAMALAKPVVATDIAGPTEIVENETTGFIVPPGDIYAMAGKISYLLKHESIAREMGQKGLKRMAGMFNARDVIRKIEEQYRQVLRVN